MILWTGPKEEKEKEKNWAVGKMGFIVLGYEDAGVEVTNMG